MHKKTLISHWSCYECIMLGYGWQFCWTLMESVYPYHSFFLQFLSLPFLADPSLPNPRLFKIHRHHQYNLSLYPSSGHYIYFIRMNDLTGGNNLSEPYPRLYTIRGWASQAISPCYESLSLCFVSISTYLYFNFFFFPFSRHVPQLIHPQIRSRALHLAYLWDWTDMIRPLFFSLPLFGDRSEPA